MSKSQKKNIWWQSMEKQWTSAEIHKLFRLHEKVKSRQTLFNAEERNEIPSAKRIARGKQQVRQWDTSQLPAIGAKYGFLQPPKRQQIFCISTGKGGVLKSTVSGNLARVFALNSIKVLVCGLDIQKSVSKMLLPEQKKIESLDDIGEPPLGLYHVLYNDAPLDEVVMKTDLPTLDVIPETTELNNLEKKLRHETRKEYVFKDRLLPLFKEYDVVIWDNAPSWSSLIECSLTASNNLLMPIGCDVGTYEALDTNLNTLHDFQETMKIDFDTFVMLPTLLDRSKLSQQIYGAYLSKYREDCFSTPIRRAVSGQEASVLSRSILEHDPTGNLAQDYYEFITTYWQKVLEAEELNTGH